MRSATWRPNGRLEGGSGGASLGRRQNLSVGWGCKCLLPLLIFERPGFLTLLVVDSPRHGAAAHQPTPTRPPHACGRACRPTCRSRSMNAPPHTNRMLVVSIWMKSPRGFFLWWGGAVWWRRRHCRVRNRRRESPRRVFLLVWVRGQGVKGRGGAMKGSAGEATGGTRVCLKRVCAPAVARAGRRAHTPPLLCVAAAPQPISLSSTHAAPPPPPPRGAPSAPAALLRHVDHRALQHAQQRLLHPLAADVTRDADVLAALGDFVHLSLTQSRQARPQKVLM